MTGEDLQRDHQKSRKRIATPGHVAGPGMRTNPILTADGPFGCIQDPTPPGTGSLARIAASLSTR